MKPNGLDATQKDGRYRTENGGSETRKEGNMVDMYTKSVLTIIATALVVLAANNVTRTALAQISFARVQVCDEQNCTRLVPIQQSGVQGRTVTIWSLPVVPSR